MRCKRLDGLLPAYMDGDLPARLNQHVSAHLDRCERCRQELTAQQRALRSLAAGRRPVSIDLWADFSRRLQAQAPPRPSPWRLLWQPGLATALAAVAVALIAGTAPKTRPAPAAELRPLLVQVAERPESEVVPPPSLPRSGPAGMPLPSDPGSRQAAASWMHVPVKHRSAASHPARWSSKRSKERRASSTHTQSPGGRFSVSHPERAMARRPETPAALLMASLPTEEQGARPGRDLASAAADHSPARAESSRAGAGDPLKIAEALVSVEQDAASDQMKGELLRLAREVARVGGEAVPGDSSELPLGGVAPGDAIRPPSPNPAGT